MTIPERCALEGEIVCKCLARTKQQCSFVEHRNYKIVYRRYALLFFLVEVDNNENTLAILAFRHLPVETMDHHFGNVCELDIMIQLEKAHFIVEEMVMNGCMVQTDKNSILSPLFISWAEYHHEKDNTKTTPSPPKRHDSVTYVQQLQR